MAATTNPLSSLHPTANLVSTETHIISGIRTTVYGRSAIPPATASVACLWLLHARLQSAESMHTIANSIVSAWNARVAASHPSTSPLGLIAVSFDQRNHGTRLIDDLHNQAWREGNPRHAQDMFSCIHGSVQDTSLLMDHLESYVFTSPKGPRITKHMALGVSLGGHEVWQCLLGEPRITAAVVGIGCPDYTRLLVDRARLTGLESFMQTSPPGRSFLGSLDFPPALLEAIARYDPAGLLLPGQFNPTGPDPPLTAEKLDRFKALARERFGGKKILTLNGADDKLVPYSMGEPFYKVLKQVVREDSSLDIHFEEVVFEGVGHAFPHAMVDKATQWIGDVLSSQHGLTSKM